MPDLRKRRLPIRTLLPAPLGRRLVGMFLVLGIVWLTLGQASGTPAILPPDKVAPKAPQAPPAPVKAASLSTPKAAFDALKQPQASPAPAKASSPCPPLIDPNTPPRDLLPPAPPLRKVSGPLLGDDLSQVPEVELQAAMEKPDPKTAAQDIAFTMARINHLNGKQTDGFLRVLREHRPDLEGLPFAMGDACRTRGDRNELFKREVGLIRLAQGGRNALARTDMIPLPLDTLHAMDEAHPRDYWVRYRAGCTHADARQAQDRPARDARTSARIAALMQVLAAESVEIRLGLAEFLATLSHVEATRALVRLAIFSGEYEVRQAALEALKVRRERDYTSILEQGLRYPLPAVAWRTAYAISKLERSDLIPRLVAVLEEPDPRTPILEEKDGKKVPVVRELVRVNHNRNCLMCHSPVGGTEVSRFNSGVPVPGQPIRSQGYARTFPELLVRIDVTYLRQDFSLMQKVADARPWPEMQRFDFLVRSRVLDKKEAAAYREKLQPREPDRLSPYQRAALVALRELTGREAEPTAAAWRKLLGLHSRRGSQEASR